MSTTTNPPERRNRASVACTACRARRSKCVYDADSTSCRHCQKIRVECIVRHDDERKRPKSRAFMNSLIEHIKLLEGQFKDIGHEPPPRRDPLLQDQALGFSKSQNSEQRDERVTEERHEQTSQSHDEDSHKEATATESVDSLPQSSANSRGWNPISHSFPMVEPQSSVTFQKQSLVIQNEPLPLKSSDIKQTRRDQAKHISTLISKNTEINCDKDGERLNYFSPIASFAGYAKEVMAPETADPEPWQLERRAQKILCGVSAELDNYLMGLFWTCYNSLFKLVNQEQFGRDKEEGGRLFYSEFLHVCCLAIGFLFADKQKPEIQRVSSGDGFSTFHRGVHYMIDAVQENPQGLATIQAMLLISDLECATGREDLGWMHLGNACRLAFNFGLNIDCTATRLSVRVIQFRQHVLRSCILYDKAWSLYLGRPTCMKTSDVAVSLLTDSFARLDNTSSTWPGRDSPEPATPGTTLESRIYDALIDLTDLTSEIAKNIHMRPSCGSYDNASWMIQMSALDNKLNKWYRELPPWLRWTPGNQKTAPSLFFITHQQFHTTFIMLHGPPAQYDEALNAKYQESESDSDSTDHMDRTRAFSRLYRSTAFENAIKVSDIYSSYRQRFARSQSSMLSLYQLSTAALVMVANIPLLKPGKQIMQLQQHLRILVDALKEMASVYISAQTNYSVLEHVLTRCGWDLKSLPTLDMSLPTCSTSSTVPVRRSNVDDDKSMSEPRKKRHVTDARSTKFSATPSQANPSTLYQPSSHSDTVPETHDLNCEYDYFQVDAPNIDKAGSKITSEKGDSSLQVDFTSGISQHMSNISPGDQSYDLLQAGELESDYLWGSADYLLDINSHHQEYILDADYEIPDLW